MMFKILVIQAANTLSDERTEFLINDRLSFMRFLGLSLSDRVPDARTIWLFREKLTRAEAIKPLFDRFDAALREAGYVAMGGQIVDASLIAAPKQRNTEEEKKAVKEGRIPQAWKAQPAKLRQKDRDARWTVKFSKAKARPDGTVPPVDIAIPTFGYQNHVSIDREHGLIRRWEATDAAAAYEGARLREGLLDKTNTASPCSATRPTARRPMRRSSKRMGSSAASIARSLSSSAQVLHRHLHLYFQTSMMEPISLKLREDGQPEPELYRSRPVIVWLLPPAQNHRLRQNFLGPI